MVNKERIELWAQALESEQYVQCWGNLRMEACWGNLRMEAPQRTQWHCALGVGMEVAQAHGVMIHYGEWEGATIPGSVATWYGLDTINPLLTLDDGNLATVVTANDSMELPFWTIAQGLRAKYLKDES